MRKLLSAVTDPRRRPRFVLWSGVAVLGFAAMFVVANMATSTRWFCNDVCHNVHADNKAAYYSSTHRNVSCIACHYPVGMDPIALSIDRADKLADIPPALFGTFEMPLNKYSHLALSMPETQCTQCHNMENRVVSPTAGVKIDHAVHAAEDITCGACHNRVAHRELPKLTLPGNERHEDFSQMTACFRCHTLEKDSPSDYRAPGACETCHDSGFDLTPASHDAKDWYDPRGDSSGHAEAALRTLESVEKASEQWAEDEHEFVEKEGRPLAVFAEKMAGYDANLKVVLPPVATVNECSTCHKSDFCSDCHGTKIPHEDGFRRSHSKTYTAQDAASCAKCHDRTRRPRFAGVTCGQCHHEQWQPERGSWASQHARVVRRDGEKTLKTCDSCHDRVWCSQCHTSGARPGY